VHVITASDQGAGLSSSGFVVHHVPRATTLNDRYSAWAKRRRPISTAAAPSKPAATETPATQPSPREGLLDRIKRDLGAMLAFPDYGRGWVLRAAFYARALQRERTFDMIVSSGPPHTGHIAGFIAALGLPIKFIVDMRDPWIRIPIKGEAFDDVVPVRRAIITRLEALIFKRASRVIANTYEFSERLKRRYPGFGVSYISNGVDPERLPAPAEKFGGLSLSYAGAMYLGRDLSPVIVAMKEFIERHPEAAGEIKLRVAGLIEANHEVRFRAQVDAAGLHDAVEVRGSVSGAEALDMTNRSHIALVLAQDQPTQVPAKLYECVGMGMTTLVVSEPDSAASREARRIGAIACAHDDIPRIVETLERVWANPASRVTPIAPIGYDDIAARMDEVLSYDVSGLAANILDSAQAFPL
jgi:glycosyltransferase involved in cell wall biosynthesis